jgi:hypothetical protein
MPIAAIRAGSTPLLREHRRRSRQHRAPDLLGVVLDPAGLREVLRELLVGSRDDREVGVDEQAGGARGP